VYDLSIILNISNRNCLFKMTADSILYHCDETLRKADIELVVVDDNSQDGLRNTLRDLRSYMNIKLVSVDILRRFPALPCYSPVIGLNAGILNASSNRLLFIQPETIFLKDNIKYAINHATDKEFIMAEAWGGTPGIAEVISRSWLKSVDYDLLTMDPCASYTTRVDVQDGGYPYVVSTTRNTIRDIGLLDVSYVGGWACDDDDWMLRHRRAGHVVGVTDRMGCYHINHNQHNTAMKPMTLANTPLHVRNMRLLYNAIQNVDAINVASNYHNNRKTTLGCITGVEYSPW